MIFSRSDTAIIEPCGAGYAELSRCADEEVMQHLAAGHGDALAVLFDRYNRLVLSIALKVVRDAGEAQDVTQEVFLALQRTVARFDPARGTTKMWILRAAYLKSLKRRQYLKLRSFYEPQPLPETLDDGAPAGMGMQWAELQRLVREILPRLREAQRRVLELAYFDGLSMPEIAKRTGEDVGNVRHHYYRGLMKLKTMLTEAAATEVEAGESSRVLDAKA